MNHNGVNINNGMNSVIHYASSVTESTDTGPHLAATRTTVDDDDLFFDEDRDNTKLEQFGDVCDIGDLVGDDYS